MLVLSLLHLGMYVCTSSVTMTFNVIWKGAYVFTQICFTSTQHSDTFHVRVTMFQCVVVSSDFMHTLRIGLWFYWVQLVFTVFCHTHTRPSFSNNSLWLPPTTTELKPHVLTEAPQSSWNTLHYPALDDQSVHRHAATSRVIPSPALPCLHSLAVNVIFRPHGRTIASAWRYFPSTSSYCVIFCCFLCYFFLNFTALVIAMPATSNKIIYFYYSTIDFD